MMINHMITCLSLIPKYKDVQCVKRRLISFGVFNICFSYQAKVFLLLRIGQPIAMKWHDINIMKWAMRDHWPRPVNLSSGRRHDGCSMFARFLTGMVALGGSLQPWSESVRGSAVRNYVPTLFRTLNSAMNQELRDRRPEDRANATGSGLCPCSAGPLNFPPLAGGGGFRSPSI